MNHDLSHGLEQMRSTSELRDARLPVNELLGTLRRRRRTRRAGIAGLAAVVVAAVAGTGVALSRLDRGDGVVSHVADWGPPYGLCGEPAPDTAPVDGLRLGVENAYKVLSPTGTWGGDVIATNDGPDPRAGYLSDITVVAVRDNAIVGVQGEAAAPDGQDVDLAPGKSASARVEVLLIACESAAVDPGRLMIKQLPLKGGPYDVYVGRTLSPERFSTDPSAWIELSSGPHPLDVDGAP